MSGRESAQGHPVAGFNLHPYRGGRLGASNVVRPGGERDTSPKLRNASPGSGGGRSLGAAQRDWPSYNRVILIGTASIGTAALVAAAIAQAVR